MNTTSTAKTETATPTVCGWCQIGAHDVARKNRCELLLDCTCTHDA